MKHEELVELVKTNSAKTKNEVAALLMTEGAKFSDIQKILKESGVKFSVSSNLREKVVGIIVNDPAIADEQVAEMVKDEHKKPLSYVKQTAPLVRMTIKMMNEA